MKVMKEVLSWVCTLGFAVVLGLSINIFVFSPCYVQGSSMEPNLHNGDSGAMSKLSHTFKSMPDYGEIVVIDSRVNQKHTFKDDLNDSLKYNLISSKLFNMQNQRYWVKRIIGKPGDTLEFKDGKVFRNEKALDEPYIKEPMEYTSKDKIVVPEGHVFVMGDNRNHSSDSRFIGPVPIENVMGKFLFTF